MQDRTLPPHQHLAAPGKWPLVGQRAAAPPNGPWRISIGGLVAQQSEWKLNDLAALPQTRKEVDIHCVTRWSKLGVAFEGVLLSELLQHVAPEPEARFVSFESQTENRHSTSLALADALKLGVILATSAEGKPLAAEHGGPIRVVTPGRYFYKSLKWLSKIELLAEDRLGYWEADAGYHNHADPWQEERYLASDLSKAEAERLISSLDFSGRDLRGIYAADRDLSGLLANRAKLRNADFSRAVLKNASFREANLSNASFASAALQMADFSGADLEGADFSGADLRGARLVNASLFGATFFQIDGDIDGAEIDAATVIDANSLSALSDEQREWVQCRIRAE